MKSLPLRLPLYLTPPHDCSYYDDREARTVFGDPRFSPDLAIQTRLAQQGFRRSGRFLYRPQCHNCSACIAARLNVATFKPDRSQRRNLRNNDELELTVQRPRCDDELLNLYNRYQQWRHPDGQMLAPGQGEYLDFLLSDWSTTRYLEMRDGDELVAIAVFDRLQDGYSAVYTFYSPEAAPRGLGTFAILKLTEMAAAEGLSHVYLGYWLPQHPKMDYKRRFRPLEVYVGGEWRELQETP